MNPKLFLTVLTSASLVVSTFGQTPENPQRRGGNNPPPQEGRPGPGGPGARGPGGPGPGGVREDRKLLKEFDRDKNKRLSLEERKAAREFLKKERAEGGGPRRPGFRGGNENQLPPEPGPKLSPAEVKSFPNAPLYDPKVVRTFFFDFESPEWESELSDFYRSDVEVPARLMVDGKTFPEVGVHFRGASSFFTVDEGRKRSMNVSLDFVGETNHLGGYRTLNLLNSHTDPTFLRSILYYQIARDYIPAPKANFARVVINGESWGIYVNAQQVNKEFIRDWFQTTEGVRWKVPGSPRAQEAGLKYLGEDAAPYKKVYDLKSKNDPKAWKDLIRLCKVLDETPDDKLEAALKPILDLEGTLKFLALENALINSDGYWIRSSDYYIYQDVKGIFHLIPHDANETFRGAGMGGGRGPGGPGGPGGPRREGGPDAGGNPRPADRPPEGNAPRPGSAPAMGRGVELSPLAGSDTNDTSKPLLKRLLGVPATRERYFGYLKTIAEKSLDWNKLGPVVREYQALIAEDVKNDTRKLQSNEMFAAAGADEVREQAGQGQRPVMSLKTFVEKRREFLLNHPEVKKAKAL